MKKSFTKKLLLLCFSLLCVSGALAQQLELEGGIDPKVVSRPVRDGVVSSCVIISSNIQMTYVTNYGEEPAIMNSGIANDMMVDTLYFFMDANSTKRRINLNASGFATATIDVNLTPKVTYKYTVIDPSAGGSEYSHLLDSWNKLSSEHKYAEAAGFYKQALTAEGAPVDLSPLHSYIKVMEDCDEYSKYAKSCLILAKKLRDENKGNLETLDKIKEYYSEALKSYNALKSYMSDDRYDVIISKITEAQKTIPVIIEGVVEDATNTSEKLAGVKVYGLASSGSKTQILLATTDEKGRFHIEIEARKMYLYKILLFDPSDVKGFRKTREVAISSIQDNAKLRIKIFK